jgi:hypothetical protein
MEAMQPFVSDSGGRVLLTSLVADDYTMCYLFHTLLVTLGLFDKSENLISTAKVSCHEAEFCRADERF